MSGEALVFRDVRVHRGPGLPPVLAGVSFSLAAGERAALVGLNGSGKTTLLSCAAGLVPHEGEVHVLGVRVGPRSLGEVRAKIGFLFNVPEDQLLFPKVVEDAAFGLLRRGVSPDEALRKGRQTLERLGVGHLADSALHRLSHGEKQRVALAGAVVLDPPLLLLDEPSSGLDPLGKRALATTLSGLDAAMLIATHDLEFAARLCSRFILLEGGGIALDVPRAEEVLRRWDGGEGQ
ncbi:MAG TPA: ABC transporter ATP-binding protein [Planctomycetota bacterium]|jgi:energy-coupling factor transporter ATP-binding protein EcfA2|nr:ABC transporter ATP-binding protein [Planctomycetota bacterium]OQC19182.1 MAG: Energy-coupling factor transporter ATP-binding protein EcfA1 [Planctomycetes bacterium ADurb.Bin069]HNS00359.1 ABC transporter ATP-binding protein [Planctomycetota bacterium]HNU26872.1 ABC transporter ATP-binding protein [Planctomycetota bacterium]HOE30956.1 ABC transporter ATP-binding protein [Planctomycetota bacterium]